jgi:glycine cleavage system transcriptional repressor
MFRKAGWWCARPSVFAADAVASAATSGYAACMDREYVVVTAMGPDRVGIVRDLSAAVVRLGGNIEQSKMAVLGGDFAVIMLVSGKQEVLRRLCDSVGPLGAEMGLRLEARVTRPKTPPEGGRLYRVETVSLDAPGIVHAVAEILRRNGANIQELDTETTSAPWTGAIMFRMRARVLVPAGTSMAALRRELEELEQERDIDTVITPGA